MLTLYIISATVGLIHVLYILTAILHPKDKYTGKISDEQDIYSVEHIVCFKNESKFIEKKLKNCYETDYSYHLHYTFVNDNSTDDTLELLEKYRQRNTEIISNKKNLGKNRSQINAVKNKQADLILFTDANVFLEKNALQNLIKYFDENTGGVCGNVIITTDMEHKTIHGKYWEIEKSIKEFQSIFGSVIGFDGGFYCVKKECYNLKKDNELSDFDTTFLLFRQGKRAGYADDAVAVELEKRRIKDSFMARMRASNRVFWSFRRIFRYIDNLKSITVIHFTLHKLARYLFIITFVLSLPFIIMDLWRISSFLLLIFFIPYIYRFVIESVALCIGGVIALTGKEYTTWYNNKI